MKEDTVKFSLENPKTVHVNDRSFCEVQKFRSTLAFAAVLSIAIGVVIVLTPPFQTPDTPVHFLKAASIAYGGFSPVLQHSQEGYFLPRDLGRFIQIFNYIPFHPHAKVGLTQFQNAAHLSWSSVSYSPFTPASFDPPFLYIPDVIGILLGRIFTLPILVSYYIAEVLNAVTAVTILAISYHIVNGRYRHFIFVVAFLPMSLSLFGSVSRDSNLTSMVILSFSIYLSHQNRIRFRTGASRIGALIPVLILLPVVITKPPYILLLLAIGLPSTEEETRLKRFLKRISPLIIGLIASVIWYEFAGSSLKTSLNAIPNLAPSYQLKFILSDPLSFINEVIKTFRILDNFYFQSIIGKLGWLDTLLPSWAYLILGIIFFGTLLTFVAGIKFSKESVVSMLLALAAFCLCIFAVEAALLVTWTPRNSPIVDGVQGRYFLPIFPLVITVPQRISTSFIPSRITDGLNNPGEILAYAFSILCIVVTATTLVSRYWLV